jgi:hypothetical protein
VIRLVVLLALLSAACARPALSPTPRLYATPDGAPSGACTERAPCTLQGCVNACPNGGSCEIVAAPGLYLNPRVNMYNYRRFYLRGNCADPSAVVLRATIPSNLITVQDYATGIIECVTCESAVSGSNCILGRQHVIVDFGHIRFGAMPGGAHVTMAEFSIASCVGPTAIVGDVHVHVGIGSMSKMNLGCAVTIPTPVTIRYFVSTAAWSEVNAAGATFHGAGALTSSGTQCMLDRSLVTPPQNGQRFPGSEPGNCF